MSTVEDMHKMISSKTNLKYNEQSHKRLHLFNIQGLFLRFRIEVKQSLSKICIIKRNNTNFTNLEYK